MQPCVTCWGEEKCEVTQEESKMNEMNVFCNTKGVYMKKTQEISVQYE